MLAAPRRMGVGVARAGLAGQWTDGSCMTNQLRRCACLERTAVAHTRLPTQVHIVSSKVAAAHSVPGHPVDKIMVVHGGLPRRDKILLEDLAEVFRFQQIPTKPGTAEAELLFDLLWSDPLESRGHSSGARGQWTWQFGPDVTRTFCNENKLSMVPGSLCPQAPSAPFSSALCVPLPSCPILRPSVQMCSSSATRHQNVASDYLWRGGRFMAH